MGDLLSKDSVMVFTSISLRSEILMFSAFILIFVSCKNAAIEIEKSELENLVYGGKIGTLYIQRNSNNATTDWDDVAVDMGGIYITRMLSSSPVSGVSGEGAGSYELSFEAIRDGIVIRFYCTVSVNEDETYVMQYSVFEDGSQIMSGTHLGTPQSPDIRIFGGDQNRFFPVLNLPRDSVYLGKVVSKYDFSAETANYSISIDDLELPIVQIQELE